jgi:TRAP-type C4-dicarboxylate transport system permease small subunit
MHAAPVTPTPPVEAGGPLLSTLAAIDKALSAVCRTVVALTGAGLLVSITIGVVARYVIEVGGVDWAEELPKQLFAWFIMAGVVLAVQKGDHIAVDVVENLLPEGVKKPLIVAMNLLVTVAYLYLAWVAVEVAGIAAAEVNPVLGTPGSLPYFALVLGAILTAAGTLVVALRVAALGSIAAPKGRPEDSVQ